MQKQYIADLKCDQYLGEFAGFLRRYQIKYEVLDDLGVFLITTTPGWAEYISKICYINYVIENKEIKPDDEVAVTSEVENNKIPVRGRNIPPVQDWLREVTGVSQMWNSGFAGKGVKVAIIDSGVAPHPDLRLAGSVNCLQNPSTKPDATGTGTRKAGIIAARNFKQDVIGVAYDCSLYSVRVLEDDGKLTPWNLYEAIEWCIDNKMDVAAITFSIRPEEVMDQDAIRRLSESIIKADQRGMVVLGPVGANNSMQVNIPALLDECYSITGVKIKDNKPPSLENLELLPNSNKGNVDFAAPGKGIVTIAPNNSYDPNYTSTGAAAAYFAGGIALILSQYRHMTPCQLIQVLITYAKRLNLGPREVGSGLANYNIPEDVPG